MAAFLSAVLTASFHGSIVILAVMVLRLVLRKTPKKFICFLWMLAGLRLLLPIPLQSRFSLQPRAIPIPAALPAVLGIIWIAVALVIASYSILSYLHLRRKVLDAVKVRGGWESDRIETAFVLGFLKPRIYIPAGMSPENRKQILAHERTHLDKGDHWMKMIGFLALALHWFNPLVWIAYILLCKDIEMACDERVVQFMELDERKAYATALLKCSTNHVHYAACPVAFGEVSVKYRIKSALSYKKPGFWISLLGVISIVFVGVCLFTTPAEQVEVVVDRQDKLAETSRQNPVTFTPPVLPESEPNPDWGLELIADITTPTGGTVVYVIEERFAALTGQMSASDAHLEKWNGREWEYLAKVSDHIATTYFAHHREDAVECWPLETDWTLSCGSLDAGDYRFVQTVKTGDRTETMRAPFHIYQEQLPTDEEAGLTRCETALDKLLSGPYQVTLFRPDLEGNMVPYRSVARNAERYRAEHYLGDYTIWYATGDEAKSEMEGWDKDFRLNQNRQFLFPEGQSVISQEEISFCSVWTEFDGTACRGRDTYRFMPDGKLSSVERVTELLDTDGDVMRTDTLRMEAAEKVTFDFLSGREYVPEDSHSAQQNSPWGIFFRVDDDYLKPTGGEVWLSTDAVGVSNYTTDGTYWLEKRVSTRWERLGGEEKTASWGEETIPISAQTQSRNVDWSLAYGSLDAGVYRMGKRISNGTESIIAYAEFSIGETGGIYGPGGVEALARVDAALKKLANSSYRAEQWNGPYNQYSTEETLTSVYWHYGDTQVWDIYEQGVYSHSAPDKPDGFFYGDWMKRSYDNDAYDCMYFVDGYSLISDREISFVQSLGRTGWADTSRLFTYRFDENGNITEIIQQYLSGVTPNGYIRYVLTPTPEAEIKSWVDKILAENR